MGAECTNEINARLPGRDRYRPLISTFGPSFDSRRFSGGSTFGVHRSRKVLSRWYVPGESFQTAEARRSVK